MTAARRPKPMTRGGAVFVWFMIVCIVLMGLLGGGAGIKAGLDGRSALANGPSGSFAPTDRTCGKSSCTWIGDFVSHDGTVTHTGIKLLDGVSVSRTDPMPARIADVRLHDDADGSIAYTEDHSWGWSLVGGALLLLLGLTMPVFLIRVLRRHQQQTQARR
ncbi:hypothetical protein [Kribbella sp. CA-293567]|uniref:hypothetical protein n=1 Tax=Kribbella sp. CA-293567 TaxID=3002436 RepID=UPI0022DD09C0|nr:hypothetical protein [Kribbella sp. CA-293567]WBQ04101.1 hypothetical protein OX958_29555 [Kribbella sp. CA-293567]